jgi:hypothetical protein
MSDDFLILEQVAICKNNKTKLPDSSEVVNALLKLEKSSKQQKYSYSLADLVGSWNLCLITGTKKTRKKVGIILGEGKYIPKLVRIQITYQSEQPTSNLGQVVNSVQIAFLQLSLTGPVKFIPQKKILAFDFTSLKVSVGGLNLYQGYFQNGSSRERLFSEKELKDQAFFKYFLIKDNFIAARGRGGGLALWSRETNTKLCSIPHESY